MLPKETFSNCFLFMFFHFFHTVPWNEDWLPMCWNNDWLNFMNTWLVSTWVCLYNLVSNISYNSQSTGCSLKNARKICIKIDKSLVLNNFPINHSWKKNDHKPILFQCTVFFCSISHRCNKTRVCLFPDYFKYYIVVVCLVIANVRLFSTLLRHDIRYDS